MVFQNTFELVNLELALKFTFLNKLHTFQCMIFCLEFHKVIFEITHKVSCPYIEKMLFLFIVEILESLGFKSS